MKNDNQMTNERNKSGKLCKFFHGLKIIIRAIIDFSAIIALVFAIMSFQNISNLNELKSYIKNRPNSRSAIVEWEKELDNIRIGYCKDYVEEMIGQPQMNETIDLDSAKYIKTTYSNSYFTLFCVYEEDSSLLGYLIIGNDASFKLNNYRCKFSLFDYTMNSAEKYCQEHGVQSILYFKNHHGYRLDTNDYCFECNFQHSDGAVEPYLIGYGVCDIGYLDSRTEFYDAANDMHIANSDYENRAEDYFKAKNDSIRNIPINSFLIMKDTHDSIELLSEYFITKTYIGMSRSAYANLQQDYNDCINSYFDKS